MMLQTGKRTNRIRAINQAGLPKRSGLISEQAGITLLEVLVAISILAVCIVAIFQAFISSFDAQLRAESYLRTFIAASDAVEYAEALKMPIGPEELNEGAVRISWEFTQNDIEEYPKLKEIVINTGWERGRRSGKFSLTTYFWDPQK